MLRCLSLLSALLTSALPSLMACEGCKEPSTVAGDSGVVGISASFSWSVIFMIGMLGFLLGGMIFMMVRSCRQLADQQQQVSEASRFASAIEPSSSSLPPSVPPETAGTAVTAIV